MKAKLFTLLCFIAMSCFSQYEIEEIENDNDLESLVWLLNETFEEEYLDRENYPRVSVIDEGDFYLDIDEGDLSVIYTTHLNDYISHSYEGNTIDIKFKKRKSVERNVRDDNGKYPYTYSSNLKIPLSTLDNDNSELRDYIFKKIKELKDN